MFKTLTRNSSTSRSNCSQNKSLNAKHIAGLRDKFYKDNDEPLNRARRHSVRQFEQKLKIHSMREKGGTLLEASTPQNIKHENRKLRNPELGKLVQRLYKVKGSLS